MKAPLKILHTEASLGWGGQEIRILTEAQGFIGRGHDVTLVCPPEARILAEAPKYGVRVLPLPIGKKRLLGLGLMVDLLRQVRFDVINTHSSTDTWLVAIALMVLGRPAPLVRTRHISAPVPRNFFSRWLYTRATTHIVTTGEALKQTLAKRNKFPAHRIDSVPTGVDTTRFRPGDRAAARAALDLPQDRPLVGIVATLRSWKGHRQLIEAVASLPQDTGLVIVGDGPMREVLEGDVERHKLRERTWFAGNQADVVPWLQALDVFALPSYANEGVPQALIQAMLVGIPCVTTDIGGIPELATDGTTALVVPPKDPKRLAAALKRLLDDPALRERLAGAAREHVASRFSLEAMLDRMEAVFRLAAGKP